MHKRKRKNFILKAVTWAAAITFVISTCAIDSLTLVPAVVCGISLAWIALFMFVNEKLIERCVEDA